MNELLKIRDLTVRFYTYDGIVKALEGVDLDIYRKETFGLVGETGCGKTLTALSILRLVPPPSQIERGNIYFSANDTGEPIDLLAISESEIRKIRGSRISMVFQEPSAVLNPVYTIGNQISEVLLLHRRQELMEKALKTINLLLEKTVGFIGTLFRPAWLVEKSLYQRLTQNSRLSLPRVISRIPVIRRVLWRLNSEANVVNQRK